MLNDLEEIAKAVQVHEATIQSFIGEKSAMKRQLIEEENDLEKLRLELKDKFNLGLEDLSALVKELEEKIKIGYQNLDDKVQQLE